MKRVLLTGATGLIGRQMLPILAEAGYEVHATCHRRNVPTELQSLANWHDLDLLQEGDAHAAIVRIAPTYLAHLAWSVAPGSNEHDVHPRWLRASQELIGSFYERGGKRAVIAGTCFEYDFTQGLCDEATTPTTPSTLYGQCKNDLRHFTEDLCAKVNRSWAWGRIFFVYGPGEHPKRLVSSIILSLLNGQPARCTHGRQLRDYLHARDVADALVRLLESEHIGPCNIGSGTPVALNEIAHAIAARTGNEHLLELGAIAAPVNEPPRIVADVTRLQGPAVSWHPKIPLAEGLAETIESWRTASSIRATSP